MTNNPKSKAPDPERYAMSGSEDGHQIALFMWAAKAVEQYPELRWMFHIPNGGFRTKREAGKLRAMGVKRGVPDIFLPVQRGPWLGLWIELKRPAKKVGRAKEGTTSGAQDKFIEYFQSQNYGVAVCVGWEKARNTIVQYLEWKE